MYRSLQPKKTKNTSRTVFFPLAFLVLVSLTLFPSLFLSFSSTANNIAMPFWYTQALAGATLSGTVSSLSTKESLVSKNKELTEAIKQLEMKVNGYDFIVQENLEFKKILSQKTKESLIATVVARPNITAYDTFLIDIGKDSGIKNGDKVLSDENTILGVIEETYPYTAKARLFSTSGQVTDSFLGPDSIPVQIKGFGGGSFIAEVPRDIDIKKGDNAIVTGTPDYLLAQVVSIEKNSEDSFQKIYLKGPVNIYNTRHVQVIKSSKP